MLLLCNTAAVWDASFSNQLVAQLFLMTGEGDVGHGERAGTKLPPGAWERAAQGRDGSGSPKGSCRGLPAGAVASAEPHGLNRSLVPAL